MLNSNVHCNVFYNKKTSLHVSNIEPKCTTDANVRFHRIVHEILVYSIEFHFERDKSNSTNLTLTSTCKDTKVAASESVKRLVNCALPLKFPSHSLIFVFLQCNAEKNKDKNKIFCLFKKENEDHRILRVCTNSKLWLVLNNRR